MRRKIRAAGLLVLLAGTALTAGQAPAGQTQTGPPPAGASGPTFKVQVDYVEVDALVTDARGNYVRDLKKEDFQVFEDGKPQAVTNFALIDIPIERAERPLFAKQAIEPDVKSNERPFDGRIYVMLLDEAHTIPSNTSLVRRAAQKFIDEKLGANDLMAVVFARGVVGGGGSYGQEFTGNKRLLSLAVQQFTGSAPRSATLNKLQDYINTSASRAAGAGSGPPQDMDRQEREFNARAMLEEMTAVSEWFSSVRGRKKTILLFSEGISYDIHDVFANGGNNAASMITQRMQDFVRSATKSNVSLYAIDPRGLMALSDGNIELTSVGAGDPNAAGLNERGLQDEARLARESLQTFAEETGGFAVVNTNGFANAYDRIVQENSAYYVLAYYPPNPKRDGKFHKIEVRVTRPGLTVRSRRGYANPTGKVPTPVKSAISAELRDTLESPLPVSGLTMKVFATPFKGVAPNASVLLGVELRGRDLSTAENSSLEMAVFAVDAKGKMKASSRETVALNLKPETRTRVEQSSIRILSRMNIPAGRYQLRVAAHDLSGGALGSVLYDLDVPDFEKLPLSMSGLALTSASSTQAPTARPDADLRQVLPGPPVASRTFPQNDQIAFFTDVYDNDVSAVHTVDITSTLTSDEGRLVFKNAEERSTTDLAGKKGGFGYGGQITLTDYPPGLYVLKVEARSRLGANATSSREVQITIVPPDSQPR
jgi:VWFA-related protein